MQFVLISITSNSKAQRVPALRGFWDLKKTRVTRNLRYWDCRGSPTDTKIPHLRVHKPKTAVLGSALLKIA